MSKSIACFGSGSGEFGELMYDNMLRVGELLAEQDVHIITGAHGGMGMEAPARGAANSGGKSTGYTLAGIPGNEFLTECVDCDKLVTAEVNWPFGSFGIRLTAMIQKADGFVICAGGGVGSFLELVALILFQAKIWKTKISKPVAILRPKGYVGPAWDDSMLQSLVDWNLLTPDGRKVIQVVSTPREAVGWVLK